MSDGLDRLRWVILVLALGFSVAVVARTAADAARERERLERWIRGAVAVGGRLSSDAGGGIKVAPCRHRGDDGCQRATSGMKPGASGGSGT